MLKTLSLLSTTQLVHRYSTGAHFHFHLLKIKNIWGSYFRAIVKFRLIPAVAYLVLTIGFFSYYLLVQREEDKQDGIHWDRNRTKAGALCSIAILYHLVYEILQMIRYGSLYFKSFGNIFDLASLGLNTFLLLYDVFNWEFMPM